MTTFQSAAAGLLLGAAGALALSVDLDLKEVSGTALKGHPVTLGIPLPEGAHQDTKTFRIVDATGKAVPAQFSALNRWWLKDGSIRTLQASFLADGAASTDTKFTLSDAGASEVASPLVVVDASDKVTVTTGPLRFTVRKDSGGMLDQAWFDRDGDGSYADGEAMLAAGLRGELTVAAAALLPGLTAGAKVSTADRKDAKVTVEENGPVRTVIRIEASTSPPGAPFGYKLRIYAWRGRADIRIDYTLKNDLLGPTGQNLFFDDFSLVFKPRFDAAQASAVFGGESSNHGGAWGAGGRLLQSAAGAYAGEGSVSGSGARAAGWLDASQSGRGGVQALVRDFWQQFPKALQTEAGGTVKVGLWPEGGQDGAGLYWLGDMQYKTHTLDLRFHADGEAASASTEFAARAARPPVPVLPVSWYADTRMPPGLMGLVPHGGRVADAYFDGPVTGDTLGWRNFWNNGRKTTITTGGTPLNQTGDPFMLSGDPAFHRRLLAWARHSADIRPVHLGGYKHPMSRSWSGFIAGGYGWRSWRNTFVEYTVPGTTWDAWYPYDDEHAWVHEMEWAYLLTGDRLYLDNLAGLGELFKVRLEGWARKTTVGPRSLAWTFELVRIQHSLTGDPEAFSILAKTVDSLAVHNQNAFLGNLNGETAGTQTFQMAMIAHHLSAFWRELPEGPHKRRLFGVLMGVGDYLTVHSWADDNRGVGRRPSEKTVPYYNNDDIGDIPALLYLATGIAGYKDKTQRIAQNLGAWWGTWKGGRAGRLVTYALTRPRADAGAPPAVTDLKAFRAEGRSDIVLLQWTTPAGARRYDIRGSAKTPVERVAAASDTSASVNWWKALGFAHHAAPGERPATDWTVVLAPGVADWNFVLRSFDADGDLANMSALSNIAKPTCCFKPDTLPMGVIPKSRKGGNRRGEVKFGVDPTRGILEVTLAAAGEPAVVKVFDSKGASRADLGVLSPARPTASWAFAGAAPGLYWMRVLRGNASEAHRFLVP